MSPATSLDPTLAVKLARLCASLRELPSALIAFSGGVDSTFVLRMARDAIHGPTIALTTTSASLPAHELDAARRLAGSIGVQHLVLATDETTIEEYASNPRNRCYFCKDNLYRLCHEHAAARGITTILDGVNADDLGDFRPGLDAAREQGVRHPLVEAGLHKAEIRAASAALGLPTWDKPAAPCLASRIPYGTRVTRERLGRIEQAENGLRALGFREFRVRFADDTARLEIAQGELARCVDPALRAAIVAAVRDAGFTRVVLDLEGFRSGSLNER